MMGVNREYTSILDGSMSCISISVIVLKVYITLVGTCVSYVTSTSVLITSNFANSALQGMLSQKSIFVSFQSKQLYLSLVCTVFEELSTH